MLRTHRHHHRKRLCLSHHSQDETLHHLQGLRFIKWGHLVIGNPFDVNFIIFPSTEIQRNSAILESSTMASLFSLTSRHALPFHLVRRPRLYDAVSLPSVYNYKFCVRSSTGFCKSDLILGKQRKLEGANIRGGYIITGENIFVSK